MRARCSVVLAVLVTALVFVGTAQAQSRPHDGTYTDPAPRGSTRVVTVVVSGHGHFASVRLGSSVVAHHTPITHAHGSWSIAFEDQTFLLAGHWLPGHPDVVAGRIGYVDRSADPVGFRATRQA